MKESDVRELGQIRQAGRCAKAAAVSGRLMGVLVLGSSLLAGCAVLDNRPPEEIVAARAEGFYGALLEQDYELAIRFTTPGYRSSPQSKQFQGEYGGSQYWSSFTIENVTCTPEEEATKCEVVASVTANMPEFPIPNVKNRVQSEWVFTEGKWYLYRR